MKLKTNAARSERGIRGFTLIELMVTIAIIAILTTIITANFSGARAKSRDAKRVSDVAQVQLALEFYFDRCNAYPASLAIPAVGTTDATCPTGINLGTYISKIPTPPAGASDTSYVYAVNTAPATDYVIKAVLEASSTALSDDIDTPFANVVDVNNPATPIDCSDSPAFNYCVGPK
jgi:prepilin-type N-terminal cleavage/methylation domain-containing protein